MQKGCSIYWQYSMHWHQLCTGWGHFPHYGTVFIFRIRGSPKSQNSYQTILSSLSNLLFLIIVFLHQSCQTLHEINCLSSLHSHFLCHVYNGHWAPNDIYGPWHHVIVCVRWVHVSQCEWVTRWLSEWVWAGSAICTCMCLLQDFSLFFSMEDIRV